MLRIIFLKEYGRYYIFVCFRFFVLRLTRLEIPIGNSILFRKDEVSTDKRKGFFIATDACKCLANYKHVVTCLPNYFFTFSNGDEKLFFFM